MTSGFPPYKWYITPAQVGIDSKKTAPESCDVYTSSALHYETKGILINPLLLDDFEFSSHFILRVYGPQYVLPWVYQKSTLKTTKPAIQESTNPVLSNENPPQIRPLFVYQQPFLEPPKIQNFNWE